MLQQLKAVMGIFQFSPCLFQLTQVIILDLFTVFVSWVIFTMVNFLKYVDTGDVTNKWAHQITNKTGFYCLFWSIFLESLEQNMLSRGV